MTPSTLCKPMTTSTSSKTAKHVLSEAAIGGIAKLQQHDDDMISMDMDMVKALNRKDTCYGE